MYQALISRQFEQTVQDRLEFNPGVVLLGPRQVGKSTLAKSIAAKYSGATYLDLQLASDRGRVANAELFFAENRDRLVILDEIQVMPELFTALRPEIDADRRPGRFLMLGSASGRLLAQSAESLAGRVSYLELAPILSHELPQKQFLEELQRLWLRGGFPLSYLAKTSAHSFQWRSDFVNTFLSRDMRELGVNIPAQTLHRFWRMLAHLQSQQFNALSIANSLGGISHNTVQSYLNIMIDTMMVRRLEPHFVNLNKRLTKSPKVYVRDSGLLHQLLNIADVNTLMGHPSTGASWEGFCIEQVCNQVPHGASVSYYRTATGNELDLVVEIGQKKIAFEIKFSSNPTLSKGFWVALDDIQADKAYVVAPVANSSPITNNVRLIPPLVSDELWA